MLQGVSDLVQGTVLRFLLAFEKNLQRTSEQQGFQTRFLKHYSQLSPFSVWQIHKHTICNSRGGMKPTATWQDLGHIANPWTRCSQWGSSGYPPCPDLSLFAVWLSVTVYFLLRQSNSCTRPNGRGRSSKFCLLKTGHLLAHRISTVYLFSKYTKLTFR
jgi:hypothetical protein